MAGAGYNTFTAGNILRATEVNTYLMQQSVMVFATAAARLAAIPAPTDGMVSYLKDTKFYYTYNGTAWLQLPNMIVPTTYTPTHNITLGSGGTLTASYQVIGKQMRVRIKVVLGASPTMPTNPSFTIPTGYTMVRTTGWLDGIVDMQQSAAGAYLGAAQIQNSTTFFARCLSASGAYVQLAAITATVPFTWAISNTIEIDVMFEVA
jgi:hypothetical protein